jgi:hypothetical protein
MCIVTEASTVVADNGGGIGRRREWLLVDPFDGGRWFELGEG